jgi:hypothetical protein
LTEVNQILQGQNQELSFHVSLLQKQLDEQKKKNEERDKRLELLESQKKMGVCVELKSIEDKIGWFRTRDGPTHNKLMTELKAEIELEKNGRSKQTKTLLLDLLFFTFASGLSFQTIGRGFFGKDGT